MAQLVEHRAIMRELLGSNPGRINTQDLKITEEKCCLCNFMYKWLDFQVNRRPRLTNIVYVQFISSLSDVKEPTHYSRRVGDEVPSVVTVLFSPVEVAGMVMMSLKRLMVYENLSRNNHKTKRDFAGCWNM